MTDHTTGSSTIYYENNQWKHHNGILVVITGLAIHQYTKRGQKEWYYCGKTINKMDKRLSYWHEKYPERFI